MPFLRMWLLQLAAMALVYVVPGQQMTLSQDTNSFTFCQPQSFIELRPLWPLRDKRELAFKFRTQLAHGLLVHHGILNQPKSLGSYDLYIKLENGRLRIIHIFHNDVTSNFIGKGLNGDIWHSVRLIINPITAEITIWLDDKSKTMIPKSLRQTPNYGLRGEPVDSVLFFGGLNPNDTIWARQYGYEQFIGCLGNIRLQVNEVNVTNLKTVSHAQVEVGCVDRCYISDLCLHKSLCVNHFYKTSCDCFGTGHEGPVCGSDDLATITLRGYSYVSYKIYEWVDKVHSDYTRITLTFRTSFDDSVLFYGFGETPTRSYVAASLKNGSVHFAIDFGDGPLELTMGKHLNDDWWHNFTVLHQGKKIQVLLDGFTSPNGSLEVNGSYHLHLDPRFYIGGVPIKAPKFGLKSVNNYVGTLREAYFGAVSLLERLKNNATTAHYHGLFPPEYGYEEVEVLPVTFFYPESKIRLTAARNDELSLHLDFKTNYSSTMLAHSGLATDELTGYWQLALENGAAIISIIAGRNKNFTIYPVKLGKELNNGQWHNVAMIIADGRAELTVDHRLSDVERIKEPILFSKKIYVGGSIQNPEAGFVGCMRQIKLNGQYMDPRNVVDSDQIEGGEISLDNCQLVDPCARPGVCEHGGKCIMKDNKVLCNCSGTGYTGQTCHFSLYRRTCEELFLVGYRKEGVYMIDIDGNGPHPPAYVFCDMANELTTTTIFTNLHPETVVRKHGMINFRMEVTYRNFTPEMLHTLVKHSKNCTQFIRFDCFKVPLGLRTYTWFRSSYLGNYLSSFGSMKDGYCKCGDSGNCSNPSKSCNCDSVDLRWRHDEADLHDPEQIGITEMFFLQPSNMANDAEGRITLGPLKCLEMDTQQYVITFKTSESFLEIPGWKTGDLAFSFKTSHKQAILFFQPALYITHSHFKIFLVNENELSFEFSVRGEPKSVNVTSQTPLNSGEWQQVWVDYDRHHVRFTINTESRMIDLEKNEEFGPFEGALYVGGAPQEYLEGSRIKAGFVGCLRGLVHNEEVTNLFSYLSPRTPQIVTGCKPSCDPNPCQNGATCHENWGAYTCECANPLAHSGKHCELNFNNIRWTPTDINENGVTFVTENGHFHQLYVDESEMPAVLTGDILANIRTYDSKGLLLYAHDQFNNYVQLHIQDGNQLVFTFNSFRQLVQGSVTYGELTKGRPVQIFVDREPEQTTLHVNDQKTVIPHPMRLVDKYRQNPWVSGQELEMVKPPRPPVEPKPYLQLFLGALDKSNMEFTLKGFIGCLTGLRFGKSDFDLLRLVDENPGTENFRKGCRMSCDTNPCKNNGYCIEDWRQMQHRCDCGKTSYFGKSCQEDIGGNFDGGSFVKHTFVPDASTYQEVRVQLAFSTSKVTPDNPAVILFVNSKVDERNYILVALTPTGDLLLEEDDGSRRVIQGFVKARSGSFADGVRHWIAYSRHMDTIEFTVDNEDITITRSKEGIYPESDQPKYGGENNDAVMVGGMEFIDNRFANYINYKGCLSNVIIVIDSFNIFPLETAYGYRPGGQNLKIVGNVGKTACATFAPYHRISVSPSSDNLTFISPPEWNPISPVFIPFTEVKLPNRDIEVAIAEATTKRVGLILGIFLLILLIGLGIYLWRVDWKDKQYRYEEEFGEDLVNFPPKKPKIVESNLRTLSLNRNNNGIYYEEPGDKALLKSSPYDMYPVGVVSADRKPILDQEEPLSDADTKLMDDSEDGTNKVEPTNELPKKNDADFSSEPDNFLHKTPSQELDWDAEPYNPDFLSSSMDDLDDVSDEDEYYEHQQQGRRPLPSARAPLSSVSESSSGAEEAEEPEEDESRERSQSPEVPTSDESPNEVEDNSMNEASELPAASAPEVKPRLKQRILRGPHPSPIFLPNNQRSFANPISYLGGPRIQFANSPRTSTESVLSLD